MQYLKFIKIYLLLFCLYTPGNVFALESYLSKKDIFSILMSSTGMSKQKAWTLIKQMEKMYGKADADPLKISGLLTGSRYNYGFFKDRKHWTFKSAFKIENSEEIVYFKDLVRAEFFNGGLVFNFSSYDFFVIALPKGISIKTLDGFNTGRGFILGSGYLLSAGGISTEFGFIKILGISLGLKIKIYSFPQLKFYLQPQPLSEEEGSIEIPSVPKTLTLRKKKL